MYTDIVPNRSSPPAVLLREGWRENGRIRKRTIANLSSWPMEKVETLRRLLRNEPLVGRHVAFDIIRKDWPHALRPLPVEGRALALPPPACGSEPAA